MNPFVVWGGFLLTSGVVVYSGTKLSRYGDMIAEKTGLGRTWIGLILMASVTSLPELMTGLSAVTLADLPNIAIGGVLGSCVFNLLILTMIDALYRHVPLSAKTHHGHILSGGFGMLMIGVVLMGLLTGGMVSPFGWIGIYSLIIIVGYLLSMRLVYQYEKRHISTYLRETAQELRYEKTPLRFAVKRYVIHALVVIVAAVLLPWIGEAISEQTGLGESFVGNIFIAIITSLPEIVVSIGAVRIDAVDLAVGNLFGSNIFNIFILAVDDIFYIKGPILAHAEPNQVIAALSAMLMTTVAIIGMTYRAEKKKLLLAWDAIGILVIYIVNMMLLYMMR